ncbi:alpha/beta fold hydrolase [Salipaludibacillus daqingensis]|uniref:alpha/beta fold hydrolase n=1 Tax=Salipaludibacillus daqingensis TaxID=3041001 RepID=UPI0024740968|nr:alpha/beta hydrolase [Salipaludibacillus daqingensis]
MYFKNDKGQVYYEVHGREGEPTIVFSHGVGMNHETFSKQVEALKHHYRIIVWDMPYHGESTNIDDHLQFSLTAAEFLVEILNTYNIDKAVFVGQSLGSFVVQHVENMFPDKVLATVHIGGGSLYPKYSSLLKLFSPLMSLMINLYPSKSLYKSFAKHKALKEDTRNYLEKVTSQRGKKVIAHLTKEMLNDMIRGISAPIEKPMLIIYGDHDLAFIKKLSIKWDQNRSNSQLVVISDAHHIANQDNPESLNKELITFLNEHVSQHHVSKNNLH